VAIWFLRFFDRTSESPKAKNQIATNRQRIANESPTNRQRKTSEKPAYKRDIEAKKSIVYSNKTGKSLH